MTKQKKILMFKNTKNLFFILESYSYLIESFPLKKDCYFNGKSVCELFKRKYSPEKFHYKFTYYNN